MKTRMLSVLLIIATIATIFTGCDKNEAGSDIPFTGNVNIEESEEKEMLTGGKQEKNTDKGKADYVLSKVLEEMSISAEDAEQWDSILKNAVWQDMLVSVEGVPMDLTKSTLGTFFDCGWNVKDEVFETEIGKHSVTLYLDNDEEKDISVTYEVTDAGMDTRDCSIKSISFDRESSVSYCLAGGITEQSTQKDLALTFGCPVLENLDAVQRENAAPQSETWIYTDDYNYRFCYVTFGDNEMRISLYLFDDYESYDERLSGILRVIETAQLNRAKKIQFAIEEYPELEWGEMKADYGVERLSEREIQPVENYTVLNNINSGLVLYVPNEDWTKLECVSWGGGVLSTDLVVQELKNRGVLPSHVGCSEYRTWEFFGLILNEEFCTYLDELSKEQEEMVLASLACSVGANWGTKDMYLDINGDGTALMTKHCLYDAAITPEAFYYLFE